MNYFLNFEEGDNITITSDFINNVEELQDKFISNIRTINRLEEEKTILEKALKIMIKEMK